MAIFTSTLVTSCKKKVGNLVTTKLRGQNVLKSYNPSPTNPSTTGQVNSRGQMANAVLFWQFFGMFFENWKYQKTSVESVYNSFVRASKSLFATAKATTKLTVCQALGNLQEIGDTKKIYFSTTQLTANSVIMSINPNGLPFIDGYIGYAVIIDPANNFQTIGSKAITAAEWAAGQMTIPVGHNNPSYVAAFATNDVIKDSTAIDWSHNNI